ncbi:hypothetical protein PG987_007266 [Apiospora arundinis]
METPTFYITHRFPCGHSAIYEHPAIVLRKMTRAGLVPRDQEFSQITVHLGTSDRCNMCPPTKPPPRTTATTTTMQHIVPGDDIAKQHGNNGVERKNTTTPPSLLKHTFCCEHNMRRPMHESVLAKLRKHEVIPPDHGSGTAEKGEAIVLEVESSYCEGCQEAKMREVHESLRALQRDLDLDLDDDPAADSEQSLRRREDKLRDVFLQLEEAHLTAELAPRHFCGSLRVFVEICVEAIASPGRLQDWVQTLTANDYLVGDVRKAVEERLRRKNQVQ